MTTATIPPLFSLPNDKLDNRYSQSIDNTTIIIQGRSSSGSDFLWPHKSVSAVTTMIKNKYYIGNYNVIDLYSLTGAVSPCQGVISHEFLHSVGLPDLYRVNGAFLSALQDGLGADEADQRERHIYPRSRQL